MQTKKSSIVILYSVFLFIETLAAQNINQTVAFYGAVSDTSDENIISMTQNLFYTQLLELDTYQVIDRRDVKYSDAIASSAENAEIILFYAEILQSGEGWDCTLHAKFPATEDETTNTRHYDSYYRVLTDAKASLAAVLQRLESQEKAIPLISPVVIPTLNSLSGTWYGEPNTDKILILKGGRGFIVYKNGATMHISVRLAGEEIIITQRGNPDTTFAPPFTWTFRFDGTGKLVGKRNGEDELDVSWERG
jgi:hypothetical protein